jgi:predicted lipid-binding transport protein (Tim44 family)
MYSISTHLRPLFAAIAAIGLAGACWMVAAPAVAASAHAVASVAMTSSLKQMRPSTAQGLTKPQPARIEPAAPLVQPSPSMPASSLGVHWGWFAAVGAGLLLVLGGLGVHVGRRSMPPSAAQGQGSSAAAITPAAAVFSKPRQQYPRQAHPAEDLMLGGESFIPGIAHALDRVPQALAATQPMQAVRAGVQAATTAQALSATQEVDPATFLREAKALFMRLTTASTAQDQAELFRLVMPDALHHLQPQIAPAGPEQSGVNFLTLDAQLLRAAKSSNTQTVADLAEVRFCGLYATAEHTAARAFDCVWSLVFDRGIWRLNGIQAL